jgi:hypothetical protein
MNGLSYDTFDFCDFTDKLDCRFTMSGLRFASAKSKIYSKPYFQPYLITKHLSSNELYPPHLTLLPYFSPVVFPVFNFQLNKVIRLNGGGTILATKVFCFLNKVGNKVFVLCQNHRTVRNHINHKNHSSDNCDATPASYGTRHPRPMRRDARVLCDATLASCGTRYKSRNELIKHKINNLFKISKQHYK